MHVHGGNGEFFGNILRVVSHGYSVSKRDTGL